MPVGASNFGVPGVALEPGDHICAIYLNQQERDEVMLPFLAEGMRAGDKCFCVVDSTPASDLLTSFGDDIDVGAAAASHQLEVLSSSEAYLRSGRFSTEEMLSFWDVNIGGALESGDYSFARGTGEMPLALRSGASRKEFFRYEAELNNFTPRYPLAILCLYDLNRIGGGILLDLLRTHRKLIVSGQIMENPYFLQPHEFYPPAS